MTQQANHQNVDLLNGPEAQIAYQQLRAMARQYRAKNPQWTVNTTMLVHEAWLKLNQHEHPFDNELHYLKTASMAMRQILVDYARYRHAAKRDRAEEMPLYDTRIPDIAGEVPLDWLDLDRALTNLAAIDPQSAEVVMLRFFAGLSVERTAEVLDISVRTSARAWRRARAFLIDRMSA